MFGTSITAAPVHSATQCDHLGALLADPMAVSAPVAFDAIDANALISACTIALQRDRIDKARYLLQRARGYLRAGRADQAHGVEDVKKVAYIREAECIGCTKCIQACPVDAIIGAAKQMHTVIVDECTGCDLCVAPCPVDCIDMVPVKETPANFKWHLGKNVSGTVGNIDIKQVS